MILLSKKEKMEKAHKRIAVVLLGGDGVRFDPQTPKQFFLFLDKPLFLYPVSTLESSDLIDEILIVTKANTQEKVRAYLEEYSISKAIGVIEGGETRQKSSLRALEYLKANGAKEEDIVLIQDGDRPNLSLDLIKESVLEAERKGASVVAIPSTDSIFLSKSEKKEVDSYLDRSLVYRVQTPQTFRFGLIYKSAKDNGEKKVTDDASLVKEMGFDVAIVLGSEDNFKINTKEDGKKFLLFLERREKA